MVCYNDKMKTTKKVLLTADRPSGNLHIGHYAGSLANRVRLQATGEFEMFIMIADLQALTDHAQDVQKVTTSVEQLMLDYLAVGLDPQKIHFVLQSAIPALYELPMFYANLVTQARLERNPTVLKRRILRHSVHRWYQLALTKPRCWNKPAKSWQLSTVCMVKLW